MERNERSTEGKASTGSEGTETEHPGRAHASPMSSSSGTSQKNEVRDRSGQRHHTTSFKVHTQIQY